MQGAHTQHFLQYCINTIRTAYNLFQLLVQWAFFQCILVRYFIREFFGKRSADKSKFIRVLNDNICLYLVNVSATRSHL